MVFVFRCNECTSLKFFSSSHEFEGEKVCDACFKRLEQTRRERRKQEHHTKKLLRRKNAKRDANEKLKRELEQEKRLAREKERRTLREKNKVTRKVEEREEDYQKKRIISMQPTLEEKAEEFAGAFDAVLYVSADVKRIKVLEWVHGKKRVALNKEREIRKTHKGGWSQEKFQRFVKSQKKKAPEWIESNLTRQGVLRGPYDEIVIECDDVSLKEVVTNILESYRQ